jgi:hypothetical protein
MRMDSNREEALLLLQQGMPPRDVAAKFGMTSQYVYALKSKTGLRGRFVEVTGERAAQLEAISNLLQNTKELSGYIKRLAESSQLEKEEVNKVVATIKLLVQDAKDLAKAV